MNRDGLALGRSLVRYLVGSLIGGVVLDSNRREEEGEEEEGRKTLSFFLSPSFFRFYERGREVERRGGRRRETERERQIVIERKIELNWIELERYS